MVTKRVAELLPDAVAIFFDDYGFDTIHPESFLKWLDEGANYDDWKTPKLTDDLRRLKAGQAIVSPLMAKSSNPRDT